MTDFDSHFRRVATAFLHGTPELRGVVALHVVDLEVLAEPLADVPFGAFAADVAQLAHGIDGGSDLAEMGRMLLREPEMVEQVLLHLFGYIVYPEADLLLRLQVPI